MRASIIVLAYNNRVELAPCLDSIVSQLGANDELIVVDNDSNDGSASMVQACFPQARLIRNQNTGYSGGNNRGAAEARGEVLMFLNPDTVAQPGALEALIAPLDQPTDIALTTACIVHMQRPNTINACGNTIHYTGLAYCRGAGQPRMSFLASTEVDAISGAACAVRRDIFTQLGGFDEQFFMYVEDTDLSWRARLAGYRCLYVAEAIIMHDYQPSYTPAKAFYLDRNRHLMLLKNITRATYLRMLPGLLLGELVTWGFLLIKGPRFWGVKPRVYHWLWARRGSIRQSRAEPTARCIDDQTLLGRMAYRLEFGQLAGAGLASLAAAVFHPAFWAARLFFLGGWS